MVKLLVCMVAGIGAGVATGFAGLSAATVISPFLIALLGFEAYDAVGIALAADVLASMIASWTYYKHKNLDIKNGVVMMAFTMLFTLIGSVIASYLPQTTMGGVSIFMTLFMGIKFIFFPATEQRTLSFIKTDFQRTALSGFCGVFIGLVCGIVGAGGGMMMLMILVIVLGYDLKTAVGTSVFIMTFTAGTGAISHFMLGNGIDLKVLVYCVIFTLLGSYVSSKIANKADVKTLNRITGGILVVVAVCTMAVNYQWI